MAKVPPNAKNPHSGIDKLIQKLSSGVSEASAGKLRQRILELIAEVPKTQDKIRLSLQLAEKTMHRDPRGAMEIAHMVYQTDKSCVAALELTVQGLVELGRFAKAEILRNEIEKLRRFQAISHAPNADGRDRRDRQVMLPPAPVPARLFDADRLSTVSPPSPSPPLSKPVAASPSSSPSSSPLVVRPPRDAADVALALKPKVDAASDAKPTEYVAHLDAIDEPRSLDLIDPASLFDVLTLKNTSAAQGDESAPAGLDELATGGELFDFYWRQGYLDEAKALLEQMRPHAKGALWWESRYAMAAQVSDKAKPDTDTSAVGSGAEGTAQRAAAQIADWKSELEALAAEKKWHLLWKNIREDLAKHPEQTSIDRAHVAYASLRKVFAGLGLQTPTWTEADGIDALKRITASVPLPRVTQILL